MMVNNEEYENSQQEDSAITPPAEKEEQKRKEYFAVWRVGNESYQLKLTTSEQMNLEKLYKCNVFSLIGDADNMPTLTTMLQVAHAAMKPWHHGIKLKNVADLYDKYIREGGNMLQFYVEVYMRIYAVSGFFSSSMEEDLTNTMEKLAEEMK